VHFLIRAVLQQATLCKSEEECPDHVYRCRRCGHFAKEEIDRCPECGADWKAIDVSHGPECPKRLLDEAMETPNGALVRRCFRILNAKALGLTITLADITEEEFRVLELIEVERQQHAADGDKASNSPQKLILRRLSPC
jgi:hypothetical protein